MIELSDEEFQETIDSIKRQVRWQLEKEREFTIDPEERDEDLVIALLEVAYDDLNASEILYKKNYYAQSIFLLQQSTEKFGKCLLVLFGFCKDEEALRKEVSHGFSLFLFEILERLIPELRTVFETSAFDKYEPAIKKYILRYKQDIKDNFELKLEVSDFKEILDFLPKFTKMSRKGLKEAQKAGVNEEIRRFLLSLTDEVISIFKQYMIEDLTSEKELQMKVDLEDLIRDADFMRIGIVTFNLITLFGFITLLCYNLEGHVNISRYYLKEEYYYCKDSDIVSISPHIRKTIKKMFKLFYGTIDLFPEDD